MKTCTVCKQQKLLSEFNKSAKGSGGLSSMCRLCASEKHREYYKANREKILTVTGKYQKQNRDKVREPKRRSACRRAESIRMSKRNANRQRPEISRAHRMVAAAIKSGRLLKKPCEKCGNGNSQAHHDDYSKPLDVRWLCSLHHNQHHAVWRKTDGNSSTTKTTTSPPATMHGPTESYW